MTAQANVMPEEIYSVVHAEFGDNISLESGHDAFKVYMKLRTSVESLFGRIDFQGANNRRMIVNCVETKIKQSVINHNCFLTLVAPADELKVEGNIILLKADLAKRLYDSLNLKATPIAGVNSKKVGNIDCLEVSQAASIYSCKIDRQKNHQINISTDQASLIDLKLEETK
jgi:hypothetical protein